ncbi:MAG: hypothetical protein QOH38_724, partial [Thermoleophilaceae bacterium]|nr:hypothetical protein [Thermoleophilaceae bacterium]
MSVAEEASGAVAAGIQVDASAGISAERMAECLRVLAEVDELPVDHPDAVAIRRATARVFKVAKQQRRSDKRRSVTAADEAVTSLTATGAPDRIDDETR